MNLRRRTTPRAWSDDARDDIARLQVLWNDLRATRGHGGAHLFGARTLADVFFTPVATRMRTYGIVLDAVSARYVDTLLADEDYRAWEAAALQEPWHIPATDAL